MNFKAITINEGLSQNSVVDIAQDSLGFIWFATKEGLNRYDGNNFKIFKKSFDGVKNIGGPSGGKLLVHGNNLWMITRGGKLEVLDLTTETFTSFNAFSGFELILPIVTSLFIETENRIWIGTAENGVYLLNAAGELITRYFDAAPDNERIVSNVINQIFKDSYGKMWILTDRGANELTNSGIKIYLENTNCKVIIDTMSRDLFLGTVDQGFYIKGRKFEDFVRFSRYEKVIPNDISVTSLFFDQDLELWIGTYGNGLYIADMNKDAVSHYVPNKRNENSQVLSIFSDNSQGIWIGTDGEGVRYFHKSLNFQILTDHNVPEEISFEKIAAITTDRKGNIWFGNAVNGLVSYDPFAKNFDVIKDWVQKNENVTALKTDDSGDLWIGTEFSGTFVLNNQTHKTKKLLTKNFDFPQQKSKNNTYTCFAKEDENRMWAGSRNSELVLLDKYKGIIEKFSEEGSNNGSIRAITRINDSLLVVGYEKNGVSTFNTLTNDFKPLAQRYIAKNLPQVEVNCLYYLNDWLWAGTAGDGILLINLKTGSSKIFKEEDGLPNNTIYGILPEDSRKVWVSSNKGLLRLTYKKQQGDLQIDKLNVYTRTNGLQSNEFNAGAFHKGEDETLYFGGNRGVNFFKGEQLPDNRNYSKVVIHEATVDNAPLKQKKTINYTERINLPYSQNSIALNYTGLTYVSPEKNNYSYQLQGYDEDWIDAGNRKYTAYTNLPPGDYLFKIKLAENIVDNAPITTLGISVATPYWRDWRFILILIVLISAIVYKIYKIRINQILELHKVKDGISADLHDDLGSRLTSIHLLSAISKAKFRKNKEVTSILSSIDKEIYESSEALDEIVWNIRKADESLNDIVAKIRRCVSEYLENHNLEYSIKTLDDFEPHKLDMQKRRGLFLICKELINNTRKHADATKVKMEISVDRKRLYVFMHDNGQGFFTEKITHRNGITNIKRRIKEWNGEIKLHSEIGKGTCIEIWIPFEQRNYLKNFLSLKWLNFNFFSP